MMSVPLTSEAIVGRIHSKPPAATQFRAAAAVELFAQMFVLRLR